MWWVGVFAFAHISDDFKTLLENNNYRLAPTADTLWKLYIPCIDFPEGALDSTSTFEENIVNLVKTNWTAALNEHQAQNANAVDYYIGNGHCAKTNGDYWADTDLLFSGNTSGKLTAEDIELVAQTLQCDTTLCHLAPCAGQHRCYKSTLPAICVPGLEYAMTDDSWAVVIILVIVSTTLIYHTFDASRV